MRTSMQVIVPARDETSRYVKPRGSVFTDGCCRTRAGKPRSPTRRCVRRDGAGAEALQQTGSE